MCIVLCPAAVIAGAINSVAGGGTLVTFPALMWALGGTPGAAIIANATNTVALCPGAIAGSWGYRRELKDLWAWVRWLALPSLIGGVAGSVIVVVAPEDSFKAMIPWLIGLATLLFILQPRLTPTAKVTDAGLETRSRGYLWLVFGLQLLIGLYGVIGVHNLMGRPKMATLTSDAPAFAALVVLARAHVPAADSATEDESAA